ncbi:ABC transporter substrate-binding protein [Paenibacillus sambharensis]|uniref:ABC transporter substrate-binding protein n=1 Tax=Paenibacillus sambharensis TaxID=1803190 RepID=A0A2W1LDQ8_9BACL|nr:ABC transporter substrate-binding protein [Paenibacillus sambharensis]
MKQRSILLLWITVFAVLASGCTARVGGSAAADRGRGNSLVIAVGSEPEGGFDPASGWGLYGSPLFQSTLLKRDNDLKIVNDLATDWNVSDDGLTWTVHIRKDAVFSDGQPLTAGDVKFTFETVRDSASAVDLTNLKEVRVEEDYAVSFHLQQPQSTFIARLITTGIIPEHAYGRKYASRPIGSGPFLLKQWDRGQQMIIEVNPEYYGEKPGFEQITILFLGEDAAYAAARAGEVDLAYIPASLSGMNVPGMRLESVHSVDNRGIMFPYVPSGGQTPDGKPVGNDVTSDPAIRKAVNTAVDRQGLVDGILEGHGSPAYTSSDGLPWWNERAVIEDNKPEKAIALLEDSGWRDTDGDGIREKDGRRAEFVLMYPAGDVIRQSLALAAAEMMKKVGIRIIVEGKSWEDLEQGMHENAVLFGWGSHDPLEMYNLYSSSYKGVEYYNPGYYSNPAVDRWLDKAMHALTEEEALVYWKNAQWDGQNGMSAAGDAPWAWLVNIDHLYLVREGLDIGRQRIQPHGHGWPITDNIAEWQWKQ